MAGAIALAGNQIESDGWHAILRTDLCTRSLSTLQEDRVVLGWCWGRGVPALAVVTPLNRHCETDRLYTCQLVSEVGVTCTVNTTTMLLVPRNQKPQHTSKGTASLPA